MDARYQVFAAHSPCILYTLPLSLSTYRCQVCVAPCSSHSLQVPQTSFMCFIYKSPYIWYTQPTGTLCVKALSLSLFSLYLYSLSVCRYQVDVDGPRTRHQASTEAGSSLCKVTVRRTGRLDTPTPPDILPPSELFEPRYISKKVGHGVVALQSIRASTQLCEYKGQKVSSCIQYPLIMMIRSCMLKSHWFINNNYVTYSYWMCLRAPEKNVQWFKHS